jgi:NodT family efflux transporter outer membrane factor (OMF) lipoprotein
MEAAEVSFWWTELHDSTVDTLVSHALNGSPTVSRAIALVDQARAVARSGRAEQLPSADFAGSVSREHSEPQAKAAANDQSTAAASLSLSWEADLFGRVRNSVAANAYRLDARIADAQAARLALIADVADGVVALRACNHAVATIEAEIRSREKVLSLTEQRQKAGFDAGVDVAISQTGLATAETNLAARRQDCAVLTNVLVVLTGDTAATITAVLSQSIPQPEPPLSPSAVPARLLKSAPGVVAAEREVAAAWSDIAVARAERLPRLDLTAALSGGWIRARGTTNDTSLSTLGVGLTVPVFDGGRGAAAISASEARYAAAVSDLDIALRAAARDVENALSAAVYSEARQESAKRAVIAAAATLKAREAQWAAGGVSQFEVEDARRQFADTQDSVIAASRDHAQAWIALMRAAGPTHFFRSSRNYDRFLPFY